MKSPEPHSSVKPPGAEGGKANLQKVATQLSSGKFARLQAAWNKIDCYLATRWPALHVTRTHIVVAVMLVIDVILLILTVGTARIDALPETWTWFAVILILAITGTVGWLINRGRHYRLLPVVRGMARTSWILLDLVSLAAINGSAILIVSAQEWRMRTLRSEETVAKDYLALGVSKEELIAWHHDFSLDDFYRQNQLWEISRRRGLSGAARENYIVKLPIKIVDALRPFAPPAALASHADGSVQERGVDMALVNLNALWRAHHRPFLQGPGQGLLFWADVLVASVLLVASLPVMTGKGLLVSSGAFAVGGILIGIVEIVFGDKGLAGWITFGVLIAVTVALSFWGLLRERGTLLTRSAFGLALFILPLSGYILFIHNEFYGWAKPTEIDSCGFVFLCVMVGLIPVCQYCINRLHAAPD